MTVIEKKIVVIGAGTYGKGLASKLIEYNNSDNMLILTKKSFVEGEDDAASDLPIQYGAFVLEILTDQNSVVGVLMVDRYSGDLFCVKTSCVVLATGGYQDLFTHQINEKKRQFGDGIALGLKLGLSGYGFGMITHSDVNVLTYGGLSADVTGTDIKGLFSLGDALVHDKRDIITIDTVITNVNETLRIEMNYDDAQILNLAQLKLNMYRLVPDLNIVRKLQDQLCGIMWKTIAVGHAADSIGIPQANHLVNIIEDGITRHAIEEYSEQANIYQLIELSELWGSIEIAKRYLTDRDAQ